MSIIFGICRPRGETVEKEELLHLAASTERYAHDGTFVHAQSHIGMGFQPFHTTDRSRMESQPLVDARGNMLVLDGRLDNYHDLCRELNVRTCDTADSQLVLAAFLRWGEGCFSLLVGDWSIVLWSAADKSLYMARDHAGTRTLYFQNTGGRVLWSTYLEQFAATAATTHLDEQYAAAFLASQPIGDLTPYPGVRAVPPAHYLVVKNGRLRSTPHWQWMTGDRLRYETDEEYEKQFLSLFRTSVERRTVAGAHILAQLSGGMDSTSIVCMSDCIRRSKDSTAELVDTLSCYDDSEPSWNERPYFSITEARRGKVGIHIQAAHDDSRLEPADHAQGVYLLPGADSTSIDGEHRFQRHLGDRDYRVTLSGVGGDELLGGVPTPSPELADYLVAGKLKRLLTQATAWCVANRTAIWHELYSTATFAADLYRRPHVERNKLPPWLTPRLRKLSAELVRQNVAGRGHIGQPPSAVANGQCWWIILETLPHRWPSFLLRSEYRYPYLDRDLVDFLFRVPREQLVHPGRRRYLMRRALKDIVPTEILERRRKAFVSRAPLLWLQKTREQIEALFADSLAAECGFIDPKALRSSLELTVRGVDQRWNAALMKTIGWELWLNARNGRRVATRPNEDDFVLQHAGASKLRADQIAS